jgi:uracil-DNA glycosylase
MPEPWNGHLKTAPLLFIGQNPAANRKGEKYPDSTWLNDGAKVLEFFEDRYRLGYSRKVPFLARALAIARKIFGPEVRPGCDFAITEAVRCKATKSVGVERAVKSCAELHLATTMKLSGARVIVCLGAIAREAFTIATGERPRVEELFPWDGRLVVCFPHPSAWGGAGQDKLPDEVLRQLREHLSLPLHDAPQGDR